MIVLYFYHLYFHINIIVTPKIDYWYWFIYIFFFFMFKKVSNISKYPFFNYFVFFFNLKRFLIPLLATSIFVLFFHLKRFLTLLTMLPFFIFFEPWSFYHYVLRKKILFLENLLYSLKIVLKFWWFQVILRFQELCKSW